MIARVNKIGNKAFSLLEVLLAAVIFVVTIAGVFSTMTAVRTPVSSKESALTAAVFGKQVLESLRSQVNYQTYYGTACLTSTCSNFDLELGQHSVPLPSSGVNWASAAMITANGGSDNLSYTVECADGTLTSCVWGAKNSMARKIDLNINY